MERERLRESVDLIREVFYYAGRFKNQTFVFQIDDKIIESNQINGIIKDLAMLKDAGIKVVIVPGAHVHIDRILNKYGIETKTDKDIRISHEDSIPFIKMAAFDVANKIMTSLSQSKVTAVIGNWVNARGKGVIDGVDFLETGVVERVAKEPLIKAIEDDLVPIFPCIGWNSQGKPYNISSRELAVSISSTLESSKLFFIGETGRIKDLGRMDLTMAKEYNGESQDLISLGLKACNNGVKRVHIVDGNIEGVILKEIFSNTGVGTMIHANSYERIRPMSENDISDVIKLMSPYVEKGILIERDQETFLKTYRDFVVYEIDKKVHACGALHSKDQWGEIAGLASDPTSKSMGSGKAVVDYLINRGKEKGIEKFFVLTTHTSDWFESLGFKKSKVNDLPEWKSSSYNKLRNSRIYIKRT